MHRRRSHLSFNLLIVILIGLFHSGLSRADENVGPEKAEHDHMVYVEPSYASTSKVSNDYLLKPYRERRGRWGGTVSLGYSSFEPTAYEPNFSTDATYGDVYGTHTLLKAPLLPMTELTAALKRNFSFGSLAVELGVGAFEATSKNSTYGDASLSLHPVRLGAVFSFDTLGPEPYVAPYVAAGVYMMFYNERLAGNSSFDGNTLPAMYMTAGLSFDLDWINRYQARLAYEESGIQNTSFYLEMRKQFASTDNSDPDFESVLDWGGGFRVEF